MAGVRHCLGLGVLWLLLCFPIRGGAQSQPPGPDSLRVDRELKVVGNRLLSVERLRDRLGAGQLLSLPQWQARMDSLAQYYSREGYPALELETRLDGASGHPGIRELRLHEGPRLVLGSLRIEPDSLARSPALQGLSPGRTVREGLLEHSLLALLEELDEDGRALAVVEIRDARFFPEGDQLLLDLELVCTRLEAVHPREIRFTGLTNSLPRTLERLARLQPDARWSPRMNRQARLRLQRSGWFSRVDGPLLARDEKGHLLLVEVDELPSYRFEGLVGLLPGGEGRSSRISFLLALDLENLLGTGRRLNLKAARPDGISQELRFRYREPFVLGLPLGLGGQLDQWVQDSTWLSRSATLEADWELGPGLELFGGLSVREVLPDSLNGRIRLGMDRSSVWSSRGGLGVDRRDDALNPTRGWRASLELESHRRRALSFRGLPALGQDLDFLRQRSEVDLFTRPLESARALVLALGVQAGRSSGQDLPIEEQVPLGGSAGPRGYRDGQFRAASWGLAQGELRWILGRSSRAWLFWDLARLEPGTGPAFTRQGRGIGLLVPINQGVLSIEYALGENLGLRQGILHFKLSSRF
jgi:outer membrane protein assembly factor BamA